MNILPKKRWHVRTKDNIARVRRDEAQAAEEERERTSRAKLAEQEARMSLLRGMASNRMTNEQKEESERIQAKFVKSSEEPETEIVPSTSSGHVNLFADLEAGEDIGNKGNTGNKEREEEKKKEQEEYEKSVGYLTYLGQDTNELTGDKSWWQKIPENRKRKHAVQKYLVGRGGKEVRESDEANESDSDKDQADPSLSKHGKLKDFLDPLNAVRKYLGTEGVQNIVNKSKSKSKLSNSHQHKKKKKKKEKESSRRKSSKSKKSKSKKSKKKHQKSESESDSESSNSEKSDKSSKSKKSKSKKSRKKHQRSEYESDSEYSNSEKSDAQERIEKQLKLEKLRAERLIREKKERERANNVLYGTPLEKSKSDKPDPNNPESARKYNAQFNPHIAKQNKLDAKEKYWLN